MSDIYTTKTAALRASKASIRKLDAKNVTITTLNTNNLTVTNAVPALDVTDFSIGGESFDTIKEQIIEDAKFKTPDDYPKFVKRVKIPTSGVYYLWNDLGALVYTNYPFSTTTNINSLFTETSIISFDYDCPNVTTATYTFEGCEELKEIVGNDFSKLKYARNMFKGCTSLEKVEIDFPALEQGDYMFEGCSKLSTINVPNFNFLKTATNMFYGTALSGTFEMDFPLLTTVSSMFSNCKNLVRFKGEFPKVTNMNSMFSSCSSFTTLETTSLDAITSANSTFYGTKITSFDYDIPNLTNAWYMFKNSRGLISFSSNVDSLSTAREMFYGCSTLETVNTEFPSLGLNGDEVSDGYQTFGSCKALKTVVTNMPNLINGQRMFMDSSALETFVCTSLDSMTSGSSMFYRCTSLTSFNSSLRSLKTASYMFYGCNSLESFTTTSLAKLTNGNYMFYGCKLNKESTLNIINLLKTENELTTSATLTLAINKNLKTDPDILAALGLNSATSSKVTLVTTQKTLEDGSIVGGGTWTINIAWN